MRQAFLVIVLVAAAFGGGAVVSGPGFRWAQEHLLDYMGLKDGGEIDSLDMPPAPGEETADSPPPSASEPLVGAAALAANRPGSSQPAEPDRPDPTPPPQTTEPFTEAQATATAQPDAAPTPEPAASEPPALLGALGSMLAPKAPEAASEPPRIPPPAPVDAGVEPASLPLLEAAAPTPAPSLAPAPAASASSASSSATGGGGGDWSEVRRKLATAGVARYTIEGEPGGRVVFACLIPLAGRQAVTQRFEAEGDDEFQAAQSVLKRINLWRASRGGAAPR